MEEKEAAREKVDFFSIALIKLVSITSPMTLLWPFYIIIGTFQARKILLREKPDLVFSK
jgi:UDP-N-acetylglucosamine:LPS N-acetylglucosamine transferase